MHRFRFAASAFALASAFAAAASAQETGAEAAGSDEIIVTARAGTLDRSKEETSYAVTVINQQTLQLRAPISLAEALRNVPGLWVEASGGEASNNIRARGIPQEGYAAVSLQEDGAPVQHDGGLGWMNADQSFRIDDTIRRVEVVRGGPASIFASYAPGGVVNFITREGGDDFEATAKYQIGDYGYHRVDGWAGGPVGETGWRFGVGGFFRRDDGVRDTGYTANEGGQIRVSLARDLGASGKLSFNVKHLDDNTIFFTGIPVTFDAEGDVTGIPGLDPNYGTLNGPALANLTVRTTRGNVAIPVDKGTDQKLTQATARVEYELENGWEVQNVLRWRTSETTRQGLFGGTVHRAADRLAFFAPFAPAGTTLQWRYTDGSAFDVANQNGNGLVSETAARQVSVAYDELINDLRFQRSLDIGGQIHDVAIGLYIAKTDEKFDRYSAAAHVDVRDNARLLNVVAVDGAGQVVGPVTDNGFYAYGTEFENAAGRGTTVALYLSDEWQITEQLRLDLGLRHERFATNGTAETKETVDLDGNAATVYDRTYTRGTGTLRPFNREYDDTAFSIGLNYQFSPEQGLFARYTDTHRLPGVGDFITNPTNTTQPTFDIKLGELGYKLGTDQLDLYVTGFYTKYDPWTFTEVVLLPDGTFSAPRTAFTETKTTGVEIEGQYRPVEWFDLGFVATWQKPEFENFRFRASPTSPEVDYTGNRLQRVPEGMWRLIPGFNLLDGDLRIEGDIQYFGERYTDVANTQKLPQYYLLSANARWDVTDRLAVFLHGTNLTNEIGLTEGNPRAGVFNAGDAGRSFFTARPELGRTVRAGVSYRF